MNKKPIKGRGVNYGRIRVYISQEDINTGDVLGVLIRRIKSETNFHLGQASRNLQNKIRTKTVTPGVYYVSLSKTEYPLRAVVIDVNIPGITIWNRHKFVSLKTL